MKSYSYSELIDSLMSIGLEDGQCVVVHSSLVHLGKMEDVKSLNLAEMHYAALKEVIGSEGTVVVPTFNFGFCQGDAFDPNTTPSVGMGMFSEYIRKLPNAIRSTHPMQSVAAVGPQAVNICEGDYETAFDSSGPFSKMIQLKARGLLLGTTMKYFSLIHFVEEQMEVPYRYTKQFTAPYGPEKKQKTYSMYVRDLDADLRPDFLKVDKIMRDKELVREVCLGMGTVQSFDVELAYNVVRAKLKDDPYWLINE